MLLEINNTMSLIWLNCLRQLKEDVENDKKKLDQIKEIVSHFNQLLCLQSIVIYNF